MKKARVDGNEVASPAYQCQDARILYGTEQMDAADSNATLVNIDTIDGPWCSCFGVLSEIAERTL